ncbi:hypothetical protein BS78_K241600, partial [Paspalum vaginatum]
IFVKICGRIISLQKDFNTTTIQELTEAACYKAKLVCLDMFAYYGGNYLWPDDCIGFYLIKKDSTVYIVTRQRAGRPNINIETLDDYMAKYKDNRLHTVNLSTSAINTVSKISSVTFLGNHPAFVIRQIMISISTIHRNGDSYNGQFTVKDIFMVNGCIIEFSSFLFSYPFNKDSCSADYRRIREIIVALLNDELNNGCPIYFLEFLNLLFVCPFEELSNSEASIRFITNHPALSSYMERIRQLTILDNILERMQGNQRLILDQNLDEPYQWTNDVITVPLMKYVYEFDGRKNAPKGASKGVVPSKAATSINPEYTDKYMGCLCFARNFFSHANFQLILEEIDAAFAVQFSTFMHELFCLVVQDPNSSNNLDILKLLGNQFSEPHAWNWPIHLASLGAPVPGPAPPHLLANSIPHLPELTQWFVSHPSSVFSIQPKSAISLALPKY